MSLKAHFSANLRRLRTRKGWSQERLAEESGLHRTYISGLERGTRNPSLQIVERLAEALKVRAAELVRESAQ